MTDLATLTAARNDDALSAALAMISDQTEPPDERVAGLVQALFAGHRERAGMEAAAEAAGQVLARLCPFVEGEAGTGYVGHACHVPPRQVAVVVAGPRYACAASVDLPTPEAARRMRARPANAAERQEAATLLIEGMTDDTPPDAEEWTSIALVVLGRALLENEESYLALAEGIRAGTVPGLVALVTPGAVQMFSMPLGPSLDMLQPAAGHA